MKGKSQEAYTDLPISECVDYNCVKNALLKAYELCQKHIVKNSETIVNKKVTLILNLPMRKKCTLIDGVGRAFEKLRQVILIEEFKGCVCDDIKTYLDEQKVENLAKAAAYADDYALTHKSTFNKNRSLGPTKKSYPEVGKKSVNVAPEKGSDKSQTSIRL